MNREKYYFFILEFNDIQKSDRSFIKLISKNETLSYPNERINSKEIIYSLEENEKLFQILNEQLSFFFQNLSQANLQEANSNLFTIKQLSDSDACIPLEMVFNEELLLLYCSLFQSNNFDILNILTHFFCIIGNKCNNFLREIPDELIILIFTCLEHFPPNNSIAIISLIANIINANIEIRKPIFIPFIPFIIQYLFQKNVQKEDLICLKKIIQCLSFDDTNLPIIISYLSHCCKISESETNSFIISYSFTIISEIIEENSDFSEIIINLCRENDLISHSSYLIGSTTEGNILRSALTFFSLCVKFLNDDDTFSLNPLIIFNLLLKYKNDNIRFNILRLLASFLSFEKYEFEIPNASFRILCSLIIDNKINDSSLLFEIANTIIDHADYYPSIVYSIITDLGTKMEINGEKELFEKWLEEKDWISFLELYENEDFMNKDNIT